MSKEPLKLNMNNVKEPIENEKLQALPGKATKLPDKQYSQNIEKTRIRSNSMEHNPKAK